jgi:hypothetical protein
LGQAGEAAVRATIDIGPKTAIQIGGRSRTPDGVLPSVLSELKNTKSLSLTQQLRDLSTYARQNSLRFDLYTRPGAQLSRPLRAAEEAGDVRITEIPF